MRPSARSLLALSLLLPLVALAAPTGLSTSQAKTAAPGPVNLSNGTNAEGTSSSFAKADHVHAVTNSAVALGTCSAATPEGTERWASGTGGTGTSARTRLCLCTSDGGSPAGYAWQTSIGGTVGSPTTCPAEAADASWPFSQTLAVATEDKGTVSEHVYWNGSAIVSTKGTPYTMVGTVPQTTSGQIPGKGMAGPYSNSNYYKTTNNADPWDMTANVLLIVQSQPITSGRPVAMFSGPTNGYMLAFNAASPTPLTYAPFSSGVLNFTPGTGLGMTPGSMTVACAGQAGSSAYANINGNWQRYQPTGFGALTPATTTQTFLGENYDGASGAFNGYLMEMLAISGASTVQAMDALCVHYTNALFGVAGFQSMRSTTSTYVVGGTRYTAGVHQPRIGASGVILDPAAFQLFALPLAPATQTITSRASAGEPLYCWMEGTGSIALTAGTFAGAGLPCTVTPASGCLLTQTGTAQTITATVSGSVTSANCTTTSAKIDLITTSGGSGASLRSGDLVRIPNAGNGSLAGLGSLEVSPNWAATAAGIDRPVIVDLPIGSPVGTTPGLGIVYVASTRVWRLYAGGAVVDSAAQSFEPGTGHVLAWSYALGAQACLTVDGAQTCGGTVTSFTPGAWLTLGAYANRTSVTASLSLGAMVTPDAGLAGSIRNVTLGPTGTPGTVRQSIACLGDSLTYGSLSTTSGYPWVLQGLLGSGYFVDNHGVAGHLIGGEAFNGSANARYWRDVEPYAYGSVVIMIGTNDVAENQTAASTEAWLQYVYDSVRAQGKRLVPVTIPPTSTFSAPQKTVRNDVNTWILGYCTTNGITCVDAGADLDDGTGAIKTIYNGDNLHLNQAGYDRVATLVRAAFP